MNITQAKKLFTKYLNNKCSHEEVELLETFLDSYQITESMDDLLNDKSLEESKDKVWQNILLQINSETKRKRRFPFNAVVIYAAAAAVVLFVAINIVFKKEIDENNLPALVE